MPKRSNDSVMLCTAPWTVMRIPLIVFVPLIILLTCELTRLSDSLVG